MIFFIEDKLFFTIMHQNEAAAEVLVSNDKKSRNKKADTGFFKATVKRKQTRSGMYI